MSDSGRQPLQVQVHRYFEYFVMLVAVLLAWGGSWVVVFVFGWFPGVDANQAFLVYLLVSLLVFALLGSVAIWAAHQVERFNRSQSGATSGGG
jgi:hypothetical protein